MWTRGSVNKLGYFLKDLMRHFIIKVAQIFGKVLAAVEMITFK